MLEYLDAATKVLVALAALGAFVLSWRNNNRITEAKKSIQEVHILMNSRLTELLEVTRKASRAEGLKEGRAETK